MEFSYKEYEESKKKKENSGNSYRGEGAQVQFLNNLLKADGDTVVVRFPYHSMEDVTINACHSVTFPGERWAKRVRCAGDGCPLCANGVKTENRFFVKMLAYITDGNGGVSVVPAIWDRPAAFADIDLKTLMQDYGDLTENLFKIRRNGQGLDTRYVANIITNKTVYNPDAYKADFSVLEGIDASKILTRPINKYLEALGVPSADTPAIDTHQETREAATETVTAPTRSAPEHVDTDFDQRRRTVDSREENTSNDPRPARRTYSF